MPCLRSYSWNSDVNTNLVMSFTLYISNVLLSCPAVHNQSTTALHHAENIPNILLAPNNGTIPLALFYRDLTSVAESCVEAADRDGAGDAAGGDVTRGVAKIVLGAGGGC